MKQSILSLLLLLSFIPAQVFADDGDGSGNGSGNGSGTNPGMETGKTPPVLPPSPGGGAIVIPGLPVDPKDPTPGKPKIPSNDRVYIQYKDYELYIDSTGEYGYFDITVEQPETEVTYVVKEVPDHSRVYLPLEAGEYTVILSCSNGKTYQGILPLK